MNEEISKKYKSKQTGRVYTITDKMIFNTMIELEREGKTFYCRYKDFIASFEKVS